MRQTSVYILIICLLWSRKLHAQQHTTANWEHRVHIGYNIGGSTPIPLPSNIRKIESYSPGFSPSVGYEIIRKPNEKWSVGAGLRVEIKGMKIKDSVQYFHTLISMNDAEFEGDFTGSNETVSKNMYISLPVFLSFNAGSGWHLKGGLYTGYLLRPYFKGTVSDGYIRKGNSLGEKVEVDRAIFNFDKELNKWDWGVFAGGEKKIDRYVVAGDLQWGIPSIFPASFRGVNFKMKNVFFTLGVKRQLFK